MVGVVSLELEKVGRAGEVVVAEGRRGEVEVEVEARGEGDGVGAFCGTGRVVLIGGGRAVAVVGREGIVDLANGFAAAAEGGAGPALALRAEICAARASF